MKPFSLVAFTALSLSGVAFAQTSTADHSSHHAPGASAAAAAPTSDGEVRKVDKEQGRVTLKHGPIANLDMPGMTMVFKVADAGHHASTSGYAGMQDRDIKALSAEQMADLRQGRGMGASLPAELNGVPGPMHALELAQELKLTPAQKSSLERITAEMKTAAQQLGHQVIAAEGELDAAFKAKAADEKTIAEATARIASLQGQLRAVHLVAHLRTQRVLSSDQVTAYNVARGYGSAAGAHKHRH